MQVALLQNHWLIGTLVSSFVLLTLVTVFRIKKQKRIREDQFDMEAISGEDVMSTQLDLARAYLEMDNKMEAKKILKTVIKNGNKTQRLEAKQLIAEYS